LNKKSYNDDVLGKLDAAIGLGIGEHATTPTLNKEQSQD
jgi:hypothetical protein